MSELFKIKYLHIYSKSNNIGKIRQKQKKKNCRLGMVWKQKFTTAKITHHKILPRSRIYSTCWESTRTPTHSLKLYCGDGHGHVRTSNTHFHSHSPIHLFFISRSLNTHLHTHMHVEWKFSFWLKTHHYSLVSNNFFWQTIFSMNTAA